MVRPKEISVCENCFLTKKRVEQWSCGFVVRVGVVNCKTNTNRNENNNNNSNINNNNRGFKGFYYTKHKYFVLMLFLIYFITQHIKFLAFWVMPHCVENVN